MEFKDKLKSLREEKKLTQEALGNAIYVSRSAIAKWEAGLGLPSETSIDALCDFFGVDRLELFPNAKAENLLVNKNIELKKSKRLLLFLLITIFIMVSTFSGILFNSYINEKKEKEMKASLFPEFIGMSLNYESLNLENSTFNQTIHCVNGEFVINKSYMYKLFVSVKIDERIYDKMVSPVIELDGVESNFSNMINYGILVDSYHVSGINHPNYYMNTYAFDFVVKESGSTSLKIVSLTYGNADAKKAVDVSKGGSFDLLVMDKSYITVNVNFNLKTLATFSISNGSSINEEILNQNSNYPMLLEKLIENEISLISNEIEFAGWKLSSEKGFNEPLFEDVVLQPILRYTANNIELKPKKDSVTIGVYQKYFPVFMLNGSLYYDGQEYSNVSCIYTSNNENVVINGKYIYLTKPATANIKVEYDLGFIKGTTNFEITALPICNVHFFGYGTIQLEYDSQLNDIICDGENWQKPLNYYQEQNEKYYLLTGKNRELKELLRVNKTTFLPVFDMEHCLNSSELFLKIYDYSKEEVSALDLPEIIEIKIGEKFNRILFSRYGNYAMNDIKMSSIYCYDGAQEVIDENGYAVREGECYIYYQLYSDALTTYSEIFKIKIVVKQS